MSTATLSETTIPIADIKIGDRIRRDMGDIRALADNIEGIGLLQPIVVNSDYHLVCGRRRLAAVELLSWDEVPFVVAHNINDVAMLLKAEAAEDIYRKDFTPSERVAMARRLRDIEAPKVNGRRGTRTDLEHGGKLPPCSAGKTRDKIGAAVGWSGRTFEKAEQIVAAAEADPERYGRLVLEMDRTGTIDWVHRRLKVAQQADALSKEPAPLPTGPFRCLVIDPPWRYKLRADDPSHRGLPYPTMSLGEIAALPVGDMACDDAVLWLWATNTHLPDAFGIAAGWGFEYKTMLTWGKHKFGTGEWLRRQTEHCLLCTKGKPTINLTNETTLLLAKSRAHSEKPDKFYEMASGSVPARKSNSSPARNAKAGRSTGTRWER